MNLIRTPYNAAAAALACAKQHRVIKHNNFSVRFSTPPSNECVCERICAHSTELALPTTAKKWICSFCYLLISTDGRVHFILSVHPFYPIFGTIGCLNYISIQMYATIKYRFHFVRRYGSMKYNSISFVQMLISIWFF